jgi:uncharacterized protein
MNVFHFGTGTRRLFGVYLPGAGDGPSARVAVLCAPWGQEYLRSHRSVRQLGLQLNAAGFHVLRFDYYGTGDSAGDMLDATMTDWEDDVAQAVDEAKDTAGADRVSLVGLRLGGALAAQVAARRPDDVKELVLWDPIVSGAAYVDELHRAAENGTPVRQTSGTVVNVNGFPLTPTVTTELAGVNLANLADRLPSRTLVVSSDASQADAPMFREFRNALARRASKAVVEIIDAPAAWVEYRGSGTALMPVSILQRITQWLS